MKLVKNCTVWCRIMCFCPEYCCSARLRCSCLDIPRESSFNSRTWNCLRFCRWNFEEGRPSANFDTFPVALLTVFQVNVLYYFFSAYVFCCILHWLAILETFGAVFLGKYDHYINNERCLPVNTTNFSSLNCFRNSLNKVDLSNYLVLG